MSVKFGPPMLERRNTSPARAPLAERMRPSAITHYVGQTHLLEDGKVLQRTLRSGYLPSLILWGPPGTGKTTLARLLAAELGHTLVDVSAITSGVKQIRQAVDEARDRRALMDKETILFVDEIHRFNKAQQDMLLPHVERGVITLIGATTENPSFEINNALLSRCRVLRLQPLNDVALDLVVDRALEEARGLGDLGLTIAEDARAGLRRAASGDARTALNILEVAANLAADSSDSTIRLEHLEEAAQQRVLPYDAGGEAHYNFASALIKSMRGSDPDAALYYAVRMLESGEDPRFVLRRLVIFASEDIGNADPQALTLATSTVQAFDFVGMPEGILAITQLVTYMACAPKSNSALTAYNAARKDVRQKGPLPVPMKLRNAPTSYMRKEGYGEGYKYPHDYPGHYVPEHYLPMELRGARYYEPSDQGFENEVRKRLVYLRRKKR